MKNSETMLRYSLYMVQNFYLKQVYGSPGQDGNTGRRYTRSLRLLVIFDLSVYEKYVWEICMCKIYATLKCIIESNSEKLWRIPILFSPIL